MFHVEHSGGTNRYVASMTRMRRFEVEKLVSHEGHSMFECSTWNIAELKKKSSTRTVFHVKHLATAERF